MQRFEESNRVLHLLDAALDETPPECHFGLACNYFGLQDYDSAADSLEDYLERSRTASSPRTRRTFSI